MRRIASHLSALEAESIHLMREVAAEFERPVLLFSVRDALGQWDPKNQRPELWNLYSGHHNRGEHIRVFPLSNWTELDIWQYIEAEDIELPTIYYAHRRPVFRRDGMLMAVTEFLPAD